MQSNRNYQALVDGFDKAEKSAPGSGSLTVAAMAATGDDGDQGMVRRDLLLDILGTRDRDGLAELLKAGGVDPDREAGGAFGSATVLDLLTQPQREMIPLARIGLDGVRDRAIARDPELLRLIPVPVRDRLRARLSIPVEAVAHLKGIKAPKADASGTIPARSGGFRESTPVREALKSMASTVIRNEGGAARRLCYAEPLFADLTRELLLDFPILISCFPDAEDEPVLADIGLPMDRLVRDGTGVYRWAADDGGPDQ